MLPRWQGRISPCIALQDHYRGRLAPLLVEREAAAVRRQPEVWQRQVRREQQVVSRQVQQARPKERAV